MTMAKRGTVARRFDLEMSILRKLRRRKERMGVMCTERPQALHGRSFIVRKYRTCFREERVEGVLLVTAPEDSRLINSTIGRVLYLKSEIPYTV